MAQSMAFNSVGPILFESVSNVTATPSHNLGDRILINSEEYVYCFNAGGSTCTAGKAVKLITGASGYSIAVTSLTDIFNPCVGVVKHADLTTATYGWVMVKGFLNVTMVSAATGDYIGVGLGVDGKFVQSAYGTSAVGTGAAVGNIMGANTGAGGLAYAFIRTGA